MTNTHKPFFPLQKMRILQLGKNIYLVVFLILVIQEHCFLTFWTPVKSNSAEGVFFLSKVLTADGVRGQNYGSKQPSHLN